MTLGVFSALIGRRAGARAGAVSLLLLSSAPFHVRFSQELRPYSLALFLTCLTLLCLDLYLAHPGPLRLACLFLTSLATAYTLYLAAAVLGLAGAALVIEDSFSRDGGRRRSARTFLKWSPAFAGALFVGYLPWWPVVVDVSRRAPLTEPLPLTWERAGRTLSFFSFAPWDGVRLEWPGLVFTALAVAGLWLAIRRERLRFLIGWSLGGGLLVETLLRIHPHYETSRRFLPAGIAVLALVALSLDFFLENRRFRAVGALVLVAILLFDLRSLTTYFREGRADWRPLALFLRQHARPHEKVFSENQYTQLCLGFYLDGKPASGPAAEPVKEVLNLDGEIVRLTWSWPPGERAWLVLGGEPRRMRLQEWSETFPSFAVPSAEGSVVKRLDPQRREAALSRAPP